MQHRQTIATAIETDDRFEPRSGVADLIVGVSGVRRNASVAACLNGRLTAFCEQERLTRVRSARLDPGMIPSESLDAVLRLTGRRPSDVVKFVLAETDAHLPDVPSLVRIDHHLAHAAGAFYTSPFDRAAVLVCDRHSVPPMSAWAAGPDGLRDCDWDSGTARNGQPGLAALYTQCAEAFGLEAGQEHQLEALARLDPGESADRLSGLMGYRDGAMWTLPGWRSLLDAWLGEDSGLAHRARVAAACQRHIGQILQDIARDVHSRVGLPTLCVGGGLFYNTYFTTALMKSGIFQDVFVAPNPGNPGLAAGAALAASTARPARSRMVSPYLGPQFDLEEIKATLDNCKLSYECVSEADAVAVTVDALRRGHLVGWFQGRMEWGHRALGNRSILASPLSRYALDNLNVFLKQRDRHRAYGVSVLESAAPGIFSGPPHSRFMEFEYEVRDRDRFRSILPMGTRALRVQTIPDAEQDALRFRELHLAFGQATGVPVLVNTSFNGLSEPMVCTPRDAVRVFFGTGLDLLVLDRFILRK